MFTFHVSLPTNKYALTYIRLSITKTRISDDSRNLQVPQTISKLENTSKSEEKTITTASLTHCYCITYLVHLQQFLHIRKLAYNAIYRLRLYFCSRTDVSVSGIHRYSIPIRLVLTSSTFAVAVITMVGE